MYYVIEIAQGDSKIAGKAIYQYETARDAIASFHKRLGTAMASDLYTSDLVMVIDDFGTNLAKEHYSSTVESE